MTSLDQLRHYPDVATLKPVLREICEEFGRVTRLDVLTSLHEGTRQAICLLRLESPEREQALMQTLGVGRFGGEIVFVVELDEALNDEIPGRPHRWTKFDDAARATPPH
jgi:hypothetical protein